MPESMIAIVGVFSCVACGVQSTGAPTVHDHFCGFESIEPNELICTGSFGTIAATKGIFARNLICSPLRVACSPLIDWNSRPICEPPIVFAPRFNPSRPPLSPKGVTLVWLESCGV